MQALAEIFMSQFQRQLAEHGFTTPEPNVNELNRLLAGIPDQPDEKLR